MHKNIEKCTYKLYYKEYYEEIIYKFTIIKFLLISIITIY